MQTIGICRDPCFARHENWQGHPESPERYFAVARGIDAFEASTTEGVVIVDIPARRAGRDELELIHAPSYLETLAETETGADSESLTLLDCETAANGHSFDAASRAAGGSIDAVGGILNGAFDSAFCAVRPPGHHAEYEKAMGFCLCNNAAIAARWALQFGGCTRVAIVDWDVHHGNGTMHSFYSDPRIMYISLHQFPHYPGTGTIEETGSGEGTGFTVNVPFPPGAGDPDYLAVCDEVLAPVLASYAPDLVIVSAGYDAHRLDSIAGIELETETFASMLRRLMGAASSARGPCVILEGGYHLGVLEEATHATLQAMTEPAMHARDGHEIGGSTRHIIDTLRTALRPVWPV